MLREVLSNLSFLVRFRSIRDFPSWRIENHSCSFQIEISLSLSLPNSAQVVFGWACITMAVKKQSSPRRIYFALCLCRF